MKDTIKGMINLAYENKDYSLGELVSDLLYDLSSTFNAPSNWRTIAEELAEEYKNTDWVMDYCRLCDYAG